MRRVPGDVLRRTTECPYEFICLGNGTWEPCPAMSRGGADALGLASAQHRRCPYLRVTAESEFCVCPTHSELYEIYGK